MGNPNRDAPARPQILGNLLAAWNRCVAEAGVLLTPVTVFEVETATAE